MTDLEHKINHILEEHQHESGLHMIGGRRRLIDRLVEFIEQGRQERSPKRLASQLARKLSSPSEISPLRQQRAFAFVW